MATTITRMLTDPIRSPYVARYRGAVFSAKVDAPRGSWIELWIGMNDAGEVEICREELGDNADWEGYQIGIDDVRYVIDWHNNNLWQWFGEAVDAEVARWRS